jgi:peptidoglycan hydrolase-like protein with peptidoglycan-binding domain
MSRAQLSYYLWWRENARNGSFLKADESYIILYAYELATTSDEEDKIASLNMLCSLLTEYTEKDIVKAVQEAMNAEGYECGTPDGISGKKTKAAIEAFQNDNGLTATGTVTEELLECLRGKGYSP